MRIVCVLYEGFQILDVAGPIAAFEIAAIVTKSSCTFEMVAAKTGPIHSSAGTCIEAIFFEECEPGDILIVPGGLGAQHPDRYHSLLQFIRNHAAEGRQVASICTGAFILAEAGLLDGCKAATHWGEAAELARRYPAVRVDPNSLFIREGNIWTSAGVTAGIDLALTLIERHFGAQVAKSVAQVLVVPLRRPGTQSQHSAVLNMLGADNRFNDILAWARSNIGANLTVEQLADRCGLSARQFSRAFSKTVGISPAKAIEKIRWEAARAEIESGVLPLDQVARRSGFSSTDHMRRAFVRLAGESPQAIKRRARDGGSTTIRP